MILWLVVMYHRIRVSQPQDMSEPDHSEDYWSCDEEDDPLYQGQVTHSRAKKEKLTHANSLISIILYFREGTL